MSAADMDGLIVLPHQRLVLLRVRLALRLGRSIKLRMPALVGWLCLRREDPVLDDQAIFEPENVEEGAVALNMPVRLGDDIRPVLTRPDDLQVRSVLGRVDG